MPANRVRIIGGEWRSRWIRFPDIEGLRPTPDRVRETVFNWLGQDLTGLTCLDLFAGSGAFGFEAASRGAREVVLVERNRRIAQSLEDNARLLCGERGPLGVVCADALEFLRRDLRMYDVVFVDPPYALWEKTADGAAALLHQLRPRLTPGAQVYLEAAQPLQLPADWHTIKNNRAGAVHYQLAQPIAR
jgi:16S rRNA (guanine966-N2)-methyltransferase